MMISVIYPKSKAYRFETSTFKISPTGMISLFTLPLIDSWQNSDSTIADIKFSKEYIMFSQRDR